MPDLASTCPDAAKRAELLAVHREAFTPDGKSKVLLVLLLVLLLPLLLLPLLPLLSHCCALSLHSSWQHTWVLFAQTWELIHDCYRCACRARASGCLQRPRQWRRAWRSSTAAGSAAPARW